MSRLWRAAIVAIAGASLSCNLDAVDIEIDGGFTEADRVAVEAAIRTWQNVASRSVYSRRGGEWLALPTVLPPGQAGFTQPSRQLIRIGTEAAGIVYAVALHEIGHALGLHHLCRDSTGTSIGKVAVERPCEPNRAFGVMDPTHHAVEFTDDDLNECRRAGAC